MTRQNNMKNEFDKLVLLSKHERMIEVVALLTERLKSDGILPIIVGGLSVEIYTRGNYTTYDIHLIADGRIKIDEILVGELGFKKEGRAWYHSNLEISIEIPSNYLEGSEDKVIEYVKIKIRATPIIWCNSYFSLLVACMKV